MMQFLLDVTFIGFYKHCPASKHLQFFYHANNLLEAFAVDEPICLLALAVRPPLLPDAHHDDKEQEEED